MKKNAISKRKIGIYVSMVLMMAVMVGAVIFMRVNMEEIAEETEIITKEYDKHYVLVTGEGETEYWDSVYQGAVEEAEELGVIVERLGKNLTAHYTKDELFQIAIDSSVDGIILEGEETPEMQKLIHEASMKQIPVVTVKEDCSLSERISFVGISSYNIGKAYGEKLLDVVNDETKNVFVLMDSNRSDVGDAITISGIQDAVSQELGEEETLTIEGMVIDNSRTFGSEEAIRDIFLDEENLPDVLICLNSVFTKCAFQAAVDYNKVGQVAILGYYSSDDILYAVSKNILQATISVDTTEMGRKCVQALDEYQSTGYVSNYLAVDTEMIEQADAKRILSEKENGGQ